MINNEAIGARSRAVLRACHNQLFNRRRQPSLRNNLHAAYDWLCRAQDAHDDGGVGAWYHLFHGWAPSYPETTGYIIPTFLAYADVFGIPEAKARAIRMADFETAVQMPTGAVRGGPMSTRVAPAVFNTGQVLFGWVAAYQTTGDVRYADAAARAAEWLTRGQDDDGAWRKDLSPLTTSKVQTYNLRTAWGLALAGRVLDEPNWIEAGRKNCDWAVGQQQRNGWFAHNGFRENENPLLHTIGYALEGVLGVGELLGEQKYIDSAEVGIAPLVKQLLKSETLKGRYDPNWRPCVNWRCLTGEAQLAVVLYRLSAHPGHESFSAVARQLLGGISETQDISGSCPEIYGAVSGSAPPWGMYCPFKYVNWAAKFYMDALLLGLYQCDVQKPSTHLGQRPEMKTQ
jgi:hypothetical protein